MAKEDVIEMEGVVTDVLPGTKFKVDMGNGHMVTATLSGRLRINSIRIMVGDRVKMEISPYDVTQGRIVWRTKG